MGHWFSICLISLITESNRCQFQQQKGNSTGNKVARPKKEILFDRKVIRFIRLVKVDRLTALSQPLISCFLPSGKAAQSSQGDTQKWIDSPPIYHDAVRNYKWKCSQLELSLELGLIQNKRPFLVHSQHEIIASFSLKYLVYGHTRLNDKHNTLSGKILHVN